MATHIESILNLLVTALSSRIDNNAAITELDVFVQSYLSSTDGNSYFVNKTLQIV